MKKLLFVAAVVALSGCNNLTPYVGTWNITGGTWSETDYTAGGRQYGHGAIDPGGSFVVDSSSDDSDLMLHIGSGTCKIKMNVVGDQAVNFGSETCRLSNGILKTYEGATLVPSDKSAKLTFSGGAVFTDGVRADYEEEINLLKSSK